MPVMDAARCGGARPDNVLVRRQLALLDEFQCHATRRRLHLHAVGSSSDTTLFSADSGGEAMRRPQSWQRASQCARLRRIAVCHFLQK